MQSKQTIIQGDCLEVMKTFADKSFDLTVTSPPYDNLRDYKGYSFDFEAIAKELFRVTVMGGVVVWVVGDSVINGSESGTSFKQALFFKEVGFNLHDTMIYLKDGTPFPDKTRYGQVFEYMFVMSKGKPKTVNQIMEKTKGYKNISQTQRQKDGTMSKMKYRTGLDERPKYNVWQYNVGYMKSTTDTIAFEHPATFPEKLAEEHIFSWSNVGDMILDPFLGSGTTLKMAKRLNRNAVGIEISKEYCEIAQRRLDAVTLPMF